jgi:hypothetical protein
MLAFTAQRGELIEVVVVSTVNSFAAMRAAIVFFKPSSDALFAVEVRAVQANGAFAFARVILGHVVGEIAQTDTAGGIAGAIGQVRDTDVLQAIEKGLAGRKSGKHVLLSSAWYLSTIAGDFGRVLLV